MEPGPQVLFNLFGNENLPVTDTLMVSWIMVVLLVIAARIVTKNLKLVPDRIQAAVEYLIILIRDQVEPMLPGEGRRFLPFISTIFIYVGVGNLIGIIPGVPSFTGDLNNTLGLALAVFLISHFEGMKDNGVWGYIKGFGQPVIFMLPINIVGELAKPISHSFHQR